MCVLIFRWWSVCVGVGYCRFGNFLVLYLKEIGETIARSRCMETFINCNHKVLIIYQYSKIIT